jgi:hypothetical protein
MQPFLVRLGVPLVVQDFFRPYLITDAGANLLFDYQDSMEHYGMAYHRVPASGHYWAAGDTLHSKSLIIAGSAMEAIAYCTLFHHQFQLDNLLFLATGTRLNAGQYHWIKQHLAGKSCTLVFENSPLGHIADLKMAAGIKGIPVAVFSAPGNGLRIRFRMRDYDFDAEQFTMSRFEKACGFRFGLRTAKSKTAVTFFDQLKAGPFIPNL